ncbi:MAG: hypothetical protein AAFP24_10610, partial [Pseudomonadota bacterium]
MRLWIVATVIGILAACTAPLAGEPVPPVDLEEIVAAAPKGPLPESPYPTHVALDLLLDPRDTRFGGTLSNTLRLVAEARGLFLH